MPYNSYVQQAADSSLNRRNSRVELEDNLKTAASGRNLNEAQAESSLMNAASNSRNAATNAAQLGIQAQGQAMDFAVKQASLAQSAGEINSRNALERDKLALTAAMGGREMDIAEAGLGIEQGRLGLDAARVGLDSRRITNEERKLPMELEGLQLQNDSQKLQYAVATLDKQLAEAMHSGNMERIPQLFALKDAAVSSQMMGFRAEESLHKWAFVGQYAKGITDAVASGNDMVAGQLYMMMRDQAEKTGMDLKTIPGLDTPPTKDNINNWKMLSEMALQSVDFQQKMLQAKLQGQGSGLDVLFKLMGADRSDRADARAETAAVQSATDFARKNIAPILGASLQRAVGKAGFVDPAEADATDIAFNNFTSTLTNFAVQSGMDPNRLTQFATEVGNNVATVSSWSTGEDYIIQKMGILPNPINGELLFEDPAEELEAVLNDDTFNNTIIPAVQTFMKGYQSNARVSSMLNNALNGMKQARTPAARARIYESLVHNVTALQNL